jgi:PKD repeat protein
MQQVLYRGIGPLATVAAVSLKTHVTYTAISGSYLVTLIVVNSNGCESIPYEEMIYVSFEPQAMFVAASECFGNFTFFENLTDTFGMEVAFWLWEFGDPASGDENTSDLFEPVHLFTAPGNYQVKLTVENIYGCSSVAAAIC